MFYNIKGIDIQIDESDLHVVEKYSWQKQISGNHVYFWHKIKTGLCKNKSVALHRILSGATIIDKNNIIFNSPLNVDHINRDSLDNRAFNLRLCTVSQNAMNRKKHLTNISGAKGVGWKKQIGKWRARIEHNGKQYHLGYYDSFDDAVKARVEAAEKMFGDFISTAEGLKP
jgi:hypothetical protein